MASKTLENIDSEQRKGRSVPDFHVGDNVKVHVKIKEGDKERIQTYAGTVIARDGKGSTETFTVRRISYGEGVERIFPVYSPSLDKIEIERGGKPRRAKLYYLREITGKKSKIKEKVAKDEQPGA